jgi:hypothetical protein
MTRRCLLSLLLGLAATSPLVGQSDSVSRSWNQPVRPFRIIDSIYYVGAFDITSFLIVTSEGLILLDGGFVETAPQILANIRALGYDPGDIRMLLNSQAHYDHAGGLAELMRATGARVYAGRGDSALLARGGRDDFFFRNRFPFPPISIDRGVVDGDRVELRRQASIAKLRRVRCDVFLAPHGSQFDLTAKMARVRSQDSRSPFIDPKGCPRYLDGAADAVAAQLRRVRATDAR